MRIAINCAFFLPKGGGIKEYIDNLVKNLSKIDKENEYILYVHRDQIEYARKNLPSGLRIKEIPFDSKNKLDRIKRSLFEQKFWLKEEKKENFDIFHSPFFHSPRLKNARLLLTVHDLRLYRFPKTYEFMRYQFLKRKVRKSIRQADYIISISEFTKQEIVDLCGVRPEKIIAIPEAINRERFAVKEQGEPADLPEGLKGKRFLLAVGHMEPRKNYLRLIEAFEKIKSENGLSDVQLVIVGKKDHSFKETLEKIDSTQGVHYLNFVSHELLVWLYKNASLFVFPSYYEGFGFPPLEAASLGTASAVSNLSSIPEVCGDAAFYFDPFDVQNISSVIASALQNPKEIESMKEKMVERLDSFSWERNAMQTLEVYKKLFDKNPV